MYSLNVVSQHTHKPVVTAILTYIFLLRGSKPGIDVDGGGGRRGCHSRGGKGKGELRDCVCYISQNRVVIETKVERILSFESFAIAVVFKPPSFYLFPPSKVVKVWILFFTNETKMKQLKRIPQMVDVVFRCLRCSPLNCCQHPTAFSMPRLRPSSPPT